VIVWIDPLLFIARQAVNARELGRSASKVMIEAVVLYIQHHEVRDWRRHQTEEAQQAHEEARHFAVASSRFKGLQLQSVVPTARRERRPTPLEEPTQPLGIPYDWNS
jgi:hypothetical protein